MNTMLQNKIAIYAWAISYVIIAALLVILGSDEIAMDGAIKIANKLFNVGTIYGVCMAIAFVFNPKGNDEIQRIAADAEATAIFLGCFFIAVAIALLG